MNNNNERGYSQEAFNAHLIPEHESEVQVVEIVGEIEPGGDGWSVRIDGKSVRVTDVGEAQPC